MLPTMYTLPAKGVPFFTPKHLHSPGTPIGPYPLDGIPTLFTPLQIRGTTLRNRIVVSPMCQYSTADSGNDIGALTPYHIMTLGNYALKGASLIFIEATGVQFNGRITPNCPGIWSDRQIEGIRNVADAIHSQGGLCGLQLAHAGRKASTVSPFIASTHDGASVRATKETMGWPDDVVGPSGGEEFTWDGMPSDDPSGGYFAPRELSVQDIQQLVTDWASAAVRSVKAGVDVLEIHAAHGYLLHQFLSPISNRRQDAYGGSFTNRIRLTVDIIKAVREVIPSNMPLFLRISGTEWMEETAVGRKLGSWDVESSVKLAKIASDLGVDLIDVSSGGNHPQQRLGLFNAKDYQTRIAAHIRKELRTAGKPMLVGAVGLITEAEQARDILDARCRDALEVGKQSFGTTKEVEVPPRVTEATSKEEPMADVVLVGRQFLRESGWVLHVAQKLGVDVAWPSQLQYAKR